MPEIKLDCGGCRSPLRFHAEAEGLRRVTGKCPHCGEVVSTAPLPVRVVEIVPTYPHAYSAEDLGTLLSLAGRATSAVIGKQIGRSAGSVRAQAIKAGVSLKIKRSA